MRPNNQLRQFLIESRSSLVQGIVSTYADDDERIRQLELAYARWLVCITFLHSHKPALSQVLVTRYKDYKQKCREQGVQPLAPWLFDFEQCIFTIDVNVLLKEKYEVEQRTGNVTTVSGRTSEESVSGDSCG